MIQPVKHDWPAIIREILAAFESADPKHSALNTLAKMLHREHTQIKRWLAGSEPRHFEGDMLLAIHGRHVSREPTIVSSPTTRPAKIGL